MGYVLSTRRMRVVQLNDRGRVVKRRTFKRGDEVTKSDLAHVDGRFEALVASGSLVDEDTLGDEESPFVDDAGLAKGLATDDSHEDSGDAPADPGYNDWDYGLLKSAYQSRMDEREAEGEDFTEAESMKREDLAAALLADDEAHSADDVDDADDE